MKHLVILFSIIIFSCAPGQDDIKVENAFSPANNNSGQPSFFYSSDSSVGLSWLESEGNGAAIKYVVYKNRNWTAPKTIVSGNKILSNWADFPGIATNGKNWLAWFLQMNNPEIFAYQIMIMQSSDAGTTWSVPQRLHTDTTLTEHGFVSAMSAGNGFQMIWLDGRNASNMSGNFSIRSAFVDFSGDVSDRKILDDNTCTCCQTSLITTGNSNFIALYRDRNDEEIRDISTVKFNNANNVEEPKTIYPDQWHIPGCPVNGPRSDYEDDEIGVVWFTMGKHGVSKVQFATSDNKGDSYSIPLLIDEGNLGRVDILAIDGAYYISYLDEVETGAEIKIVKVHDNKIVNTYSVAEVSLSRNTGFPRMAFSKYSGGIFIAYTDAELKKVMLKFLEV